MKIVNVVLGTMFGFFITAFLWLLLSGGVFVILLILSSSFTSLIPINIFWMNISIKVLGAVSVIGAIVGAILRMRAEK